MCKQQMLHFFDSFSSPPMSSKCGRYAQFCNTAEICDSGLIAGMVYSPKVTSGCVHWPSGAMRSTDTIPLSG
jgi:hypothetical protein